MSIRGLHEIAFPPLWDSCPIGGECHFCGVSPMGHLVLIDLRSFLFVVMGLFFFLDIGRTFSYLLKHLNNIKYAIKGSWE